MQNLPRNFILGEGISVFRVILNVLFLGSVLTEGSLCTKPPTSWVSSKILAGKVFFTPEE